MKLYDIYTCDCGRTSNDMRADEPLGLYVGGKWFCSSVCLDAAILRALPYLRRESQGQ